MVEITKELLLLAAGARYRSYQDEEKRKKGQQTVDLKGDPLTDEAGSFEKQEGWGGG